MSQPYRFSTPIKVRFNETDLQGHVNFGHYLFYFDAALTEYLEAIDYSYQRMLEDGLDMLYLESHCEYKSPAQWPEVLNVHTRIGHLGNRSIRFELDVRAQADGRQVATGHVVAVTVTREGWEPAPIPQGLREAVESYEGSTVE
jgi:acyl-CoA thioester hydrolase